MRRTEEENRKQVVSYGFIFSILRSSRGSREQFSNTLKNIVCKEGEIRKLTKILDKDISDQKEIENLSLELFPILVDYLARIMFQDVKEVSSVDCAFIIEFENYQAWKKHESGDFELKSDLGKINFVNYFKSEEEKISFFKELFEKVRMLYLEQKQCFSQVYTNMYKPQKATYLKVVR